MQYLPFIFQIIIVFASFVKINDAFKLLGMPRFLAHSLSPVASSVAGQEIVKSSPVARDLEPINVSQSRELKKITDKDFSEQVLESDGLSIVFFTSSWCGPCRNMQKNLEDFKAIYSQHSRFCSIDTDYNPDSAAEFQIRSIPSTLFFKNGKLVSEIVGSVPHSVIEYQIMKHSAAV